MIIKGICTNEDLRMPEIREFNVDLQEGEICLPMRIAALNHRDVWITKGQYSSIIPNCIMGSDGIGILNGKRYTMYPAKEWGSSQAYQSRNFQVLGMPSHGTFASHHITHKSNLVEVPDYLTDEEAASFPLAALTAYRALFTKGQINTGDKVLINGIGGGVALFAAQFSQAIGAEVYFTTGHDWKLNKAKELGFKNGVIYQQSDWVSILSAMAASFNIILDSAGGNRMSDYLKLIGYGGRIVIYGGGLGKMDGLSPQTIFWKQVSIIGSTMGSPLEFIQMIKFMEKHQIRPIIDSVYPFTEYKLAFQKMEEGRQFGKIVLKL